MKTPPPLVPNDVHSTRPQRWDAWEEMKFRRSRKTTISVAVPGPQENAPMWLICTLDNRVYVLRWNERALSLQRLLHYQTYDYLHRYSVIMRDEGLLSHSANILLIDTISRMHDCRSDRSRRRTLSIKDGSYWTVSIRDRVFMRIRSVGP